MTRLQPGTLPTEASFLPWGRRKQKGLALELWAKSQWVGGSGSHCSYSPAGRRPRASARLPFRAAGPEDVLAGPGTTRCAIFLEQALGCRWGAWFRRGDCSGPCMKALSAGPGWPCPAGVVAERTVCKPFTRQMPGELPSCRGDPPARLGPSTCAGHTAGPVALRKKDDSKDTSAEGRSSARGAGRRARRCQ